MMKQIILLVILSAGLVLTATAQPKTVTDFYLAMPSGVYDTTIEGKKITNKAALTKLRKSFIKVEDIKNGYLKIEGGWEGWAEIVLFKKKDGSYLIAQAESGCGPACDGFVKFFNYKGGKWTDVTKQVFPEPTSKEVAQTFNSMKGANDEEADEEGFPFYYLLPREGKIMKLACNMCSNDEDDFAIMEFEWNGSKFIKK